MSEYGENNVPRKEKALVLIAILFGCLIGSVSIVWAATRVVTPTNIVLQEDLAALVTAAGTYNFMISVSGGTYTSQYSNGTVYSSSINSTALTESTLGALTNGTVVLKGVAFNLALMNSIPANVRVICSYQDEIVEFINPLDKSGSPYTIEVGAGVTNGYYTGKDSQNRICWTSTDVATVTNNALLAGPKVVLYGNGTWVMNGASPIFINNGNYFDMGAVNLTIPDNANLTSISYTPPNTGWVSGALSIVTMITNRDHTNGNSNFTVTGGIIDANGNTQNQTIRWATMWFEKCKNFEVFGVNSQDVQWWNNQLNSLKAWNYLITNCVDLRFHNNRGYHSGYANMYIADSNHNIDVYDNDFGDAQIRNIAVTCIAGQESITAFVDTSNIQIHNNFFNQTMRRSSVPTESGIDYVTGGQVISVFEAQNVKFYNNRVEVYNSTAAVKMSASQNVDYYDNDIYIYSGAGVYICSENYTTVAPAICVNNTIRNNRITVGLANNNGIVIGETGFTIANLKIDSNIITVPYHAIQVLDVNLVNSQITDNTLISSAARGLNIESGIINSTISGNTINIYSSAIYLNNAVNNLIFGNTIVNGLYGIFEVGSSTSNSIYGNNVYGASDVSHKIFLAAGSNSTVSNNVGGASTDSSFTTQIIITIGTGTAITDTSYPANSGRVAYGYWNPADYVGHTIIAVYFEVQATVSANTGHMMLLAGGANITSSEVSITSTSNQATTVRSGNIFSSMPTSASSLSFNRYIETSGTLTYYNTRLIVICA